MTMTTTKTETETETETKNTSIPDAKASVSPILVPFDSRFPCEKSVLNMNI